jgi:hypothetical protein
VLNTTWGLYHLGCTHTHTYIYIYICIIYDATQMGQHSKTVDRIWNIDTTYILHPFHLQPSSPCMPQGVDGLCSLCEDPDLWLAYALCPICRQVPRGWVEIAIKTWGLVGFKGI